MYSSMKKVNYHVPHQNKYIALQFPANSDFVAKK